MRKKGLTSKPDATPGAQKELDKAEKQFDQFEKEIKDLTLDSMNAAPKEAPSEVQVVKETSRRTKTSTSSQNARSLLRKSSMRSSAKIITSLRNTSNSLRRIKRLLERRLTCGTKPFPGMPAEEWEIPTNKPIWAPRYVAEQIKKCTFHRLVMEDRPVSADHAGSYYGSMISKNTIQRLDAHPVVERKSVFMGASGF